MFHKLIEDWYAKWNNLFSLLVYSAVMLFFIDYWLQTLPTVFEHPAWKLYSNEFPRLFVIFLGSSFFVCKFFDREIQKEISTLYYCWIYSIAWIVLFIVLKHVKVLFYWALFFIYFEISSNFKILRFKLLRKKNLFHWFCLTLPVVFLLMASLSKENSISDYYFFAQPYYLLLRWLSLLYIGWLIAAWLTYLFDVAITYSKIRECEKLKKQPGFVDRWKIVAASSNRTFWLDLETFKEGIRPQAWIMRISLPTKPWRFQGDFYEPLCFSTLEEIDCSDQSSRTLNERFFSGYGPEEIKFSEPSEYKEEFVTAGQGSVWEACIHEICEENRKRSDDFANEITPPQEIN